MEYKDPNDVIEKPCCKETKKDSVSPKKISSDEFEQLISGKILDEKIFAKILLIERFKNEDIDLFDDFIAKYFLKKYLAYVKKVVVLETNDSGCREILNILACYLKIAGLPDFISYLVNKKGIPEKLKMLKPKESTHIAHPIFKSEIPFRKFKIFELCKCILKNDFKDSNIFILAYLICLDSRELYKGSYEVFYIIDYLIKDEILDSTEIKDQKIMGYSQSKNDESGDENVKAVINNKQDKEDVKAMINNSLSKDNNLDLKGIKEAIQNNPGKDNSVDSINLKRNDNLTICTDKFNLRSNEIILNWSNYCQNEFSGTIFSFSTIHFFETEILYLTDFKTLINVILNRKSHKLLFLKLDFILKMIQIIDPKILLNILENRNAKDPEITKSKFQAEITFSYYSSTGSKKNIQHDFLNKILYLSFSNETTKFTDLIVMKLYRNSILDQESVKDFVIYSSFCPSCYFAICKNIDIKYIKCFNIWLNNLKKYNYSSSNIDLISKKQDILSIYSNKDDIFDQYLNDVILANIAGSKFFRIHTLQGFKKIVRIFKELNLDLPVEKLLKIDQNIFKNIQSSIRYQSNPTKEFIDRIVFLLQSSDSEHNYKIPSNFLRRSIKYEYISSSIFIMFKSEKYSLFKFGYKKLMEESLRFILNNSTHKVDAKKEKEMCKRDLLDMIFMELKSRTYSKFYQKILGFLLRKNFLRSLFFISPSPFGLAMISKFQDLNKVNNIVPGKHLNEIQNEQIVGNNLPIGLYLYKGCLKIEKVYKKFTFYSNLILFMGYLDDMTILKIGDQLEIRLMDKDIVICEISKEKMDGNENIYRKIFSIHELAKNNNCSSENINSDSIKVYRNQNSSNSKLGDFGVINKNPNNCKINKNSSVNYAPILLSIAVTCQKNRISVIINSSEEEIKIKEKIDFLEINEKFYGAMRNLFYVESNTYHKNVGNYELYKSLNDSMDLNLVFRLSDLINGRELYDKFLNPLGKILRYKGKGRKGVFMDSMHPFYLTSEKNYVITKNLVENRR